MKKACALALVLAAALLALPLTAAAPPAPAPLAASAAAPPAVLAQALGLAPGTLVTPAPQPMTICPIIGNNCCKIQFVNGCRICTDYVTCHLN